MFMTEQKLQARLEELERLRHRPLLSFDRLDILPDPEGENAAMPPADESPEWNTVPLGERWIGRDRYLWLRLEAELPQTQPGHRTVGVFDFGRTSHGSNQGFESLLFANGSPRQGVDSNHREVFLDDLAGSAVKLHFRLWSGLEGGGPPTPQEHTLSRAEIALLHIAADDLYYTGRAMLETAVLLGDKRPEHGDLLNALNRPLNRIDWSKPGSGGFYESVSAASEELRERLDALREAYPQSVDPVTVRCVGHTHIDVAWLWRLRHTREKAARSFSTVLALMNDYPDYVFLQTQPQLYAYIKQDYPQLYEQIRERIAEGRWEAGGAMWLEADCNLTSGESLVRQILRGTRFFQDEFGAENRYLWLPDVFGYSWALPQILRKSGITSFMTTKISWNQYNRMPHDTFVWRGIDGSEVLTHFITTPEIEFPQETYYTYNGYIVPATVQGIWEQYQDRQMNRELLLCYGYGDGGGGVNRDMLEMRRRLEQMPGLPKTVTGRADDFFEKLERTAAETEGYVHTWDGELYLENHRGTYTSQAWIKRANRKLELALRRSEILNVAAGLFGEHDAVQGQHLLDEAWTIALRNQFHDIIPGSSIGEVYQDAREEYAEAERLTAESDRASIAALARTGRQSGDNQADLPNGESVSGKRVYTVFNDSSWAVAGLVEIAEPAIIPENRLSGASVPQLAERTPDSANATRKEAAAGGSWQSVDGQKLTAQRTNSGWLVEPGEIGALGFGRIVYALHESDDAEPSEISADEPFIWKAGTGRNTLETPFYRIEWDESGRISRLYDREYRREVLAAGESGNALQVFEDKPLQFDAWNIDLFYGEKMRTVDNLAGMRLIENGPLRASVEFEWTYGQSRIRQVMQVYAASRRIDFCTRIDWQERRQLLKVAFPVDIRATEASYDIQFGSVKRPTHWNTSWDYARFETVGHQWADLSERGYGVSLLNDCKYGYDIKDRTLRLSLIKSAEYPDPEADLGEHEFTYALLPHTGDWAEGRTAQEAWNLNSPLSVWEGEAGPIGRSLLEVSARHAQIDAIKLAEDGQGYIVRLHECEGRSGEVRLSGLSEHAVWRETDLMERPIGEEQTGEPRRMLKPYEIATFRIRL